jgi:nitrate/TMAO reductase-like tetraheme cytochrome c subunit
MLDLGAIFALVIALLVAAAAFLGSGPMARSRWGRRGLLVGAALLPIAASAASFKAGVSESSRTRFCLSCHEMQEYGKSLFVDERRALPAVHYQNRLVDRETACYGCHTDYALFGDVKAKLNGLKHVYVHYLGTVPQRPKLYQPYPNYNCLHCHEDARRFLEAPAHQPVSAQLRAGTLSCLGCHNLGHDHAAVAERRFWQAE